MLTFNPTKNHSEVAIFDAGMVGMSFAQARLNQGPFKGEVLIDINIKQAEGETMD